MDGSRFDGLARNLAQTASRRGFLAGLLGLGGGLAGGARVGAACGPDQVDRRGVGCFCATTGRAPGADGLCPCRAGLTRCGDASVDTERDSANCGGCGNVCPTIANATAICSRGQCVITCNPGFKDCNGACIPADCYCTAADCPPPTNPCQYEATCHNNVCGYDPAADGTICNDPGPCDLPVYCDGVSTECPGSGGPQPNDTPCGDGRICCGGECVFATLSTNCGSCGNICETGYACSAGTCVEVQACPVASGYCSSGETCALADLDPADPSNSPQGCRPADSVLCPFEGELASLPPLCCPATDTCQTRVIDGQTVPRCSSDTP